MVARTFGGIWSRAYVLLTFTALFWAGNAIVARAARDLVPPVALAFWRWSFALLIILPFAWRHLQRDCHHIRENWQILALLGCLGIGAFNTLLYTGLQDTTALNAMLLQSGQPALILLVGSLAMGDRTSWRQIAEAVVALAGVLSIIARGNLGALADLRFNAGDLIIGFAVLLWAIYSVLLRRRPPIHPLSLFAVTLVVGILLHRALLRCGSPLRQDDKPAAQQLPGHRICEPFSFGAGLSVLQSGCRADRLGRNRNVHEYPSGARCRSCHPFSR